MSYDIAFNRKIIRCIILILIIFVAAVCFSTEDVSADDSKTVLVKKTTKKIEYKDSRTISFSTDEDMIFMIKIKVTVVETYKDPAAKMKKGGFRIRLKDEDGYEIQNDYTSLKGYREGDVYESWFYSDGFFQSAGDYKYIINNNSSADYKVQYSIIGYTKFSKSASIKKSVSKRSGNWIRIGKLGDGFPYIKKIKSSNRKAVNDWEISPGGTVYVWAHAKGKSTITIRLKNGKKYKTRVRVKPGDPNMMACLWDYNTKGNYFVVKVKNCGPRTVTIIRNGSKVVDSDYKRFDRWIKSGQSVKIKPGKTKKIKFRVRGSTTWYDYEDFTLFSKIKYEGRTYQWHVWSCDSVFKLGKYWYTTYWDEDEYYDDWLP